MNRYLQACAMVLLFAGMPTAQSEQPRNHVGYYIEQHGEVPASRDTRVANAVRIFERVRAVADKSSQRLPRLVVVDSDRAPHAIALPDGHIVLSRQALTICERLKSKASACLAFVLGHELAHLANDDFWHQEAYGFLASRPDTRRIARFLRDRRQLEQIELAADDKGYVFAAMAGYPVHSLLQAAPGEPDFFDHWLAQSPNQGVDRSQGAATRAAVLRRRLAELDARLDFFQFGTWLGHFDYCDDAVFFLREFRNAFPGREVLNNLGYCYLQLARKAMPAERAYFYWMPQQLDGETRAAAFAQRGAKSLKSLGEAADDRSTPLLNKARDYLRRATEADPGYRPARVNLAVTLLYLGLPHEARAAIEEALRHSPGDRDLRLLAALTLYEQGDADVDLWPKAVDRIEALVATQDSTPMAQFNLGRLLQARGQHAAARQHWSRLADSVGRLPAAVRRIVCHVPGAAQAQDARSCRQRTTSVARPLRWRWPLPVEGLQRFSARAIAAELEGWSRSPFDGYDGRLHGHLYRRADGTAAVLEIDGYIQAQMIRGNNLVASKDLAAYCPMPLRRRSMGHGEAWSCQGWAALVTARGVEQLWWVAR